MKSEPTAYSIADLKTEGVTAWDGVRNYQARNFMRDDMKPGDRVFFYHSNTHPVGIVGEAEVVKKGYPDSTAWDPRERHYDPKSRPDRPRWFRVDIRFIRSSRDVITLDRLRGIPLLQGMEVLKRGSRLSVSPVTPEAYRIIQKLPEWSSLSRDKA
jgi:predicted RNA-binding protein with PUA-like domain